MKSISAPFLFVLAFMLLSLWSCDPSKLGADPFADLAEAMTGTFQTELPDGGTGTLDISRILEESTDGFWLLAHETAGDSDSIPPMEWVFHLNKMKSMYLVNVYGLPYGDSDDAGHDTEHLSPDDLVLATGCGVYMKKTGKGFAGSTLNNTCNWGMEGISYINMDMAVFKDRLEFVQQNFDDQGMIVSGQVDGKPQVYTKTKNHPLHADHGDDHGHH